MNTNIKKESPQCGEAFADSEEYETRSGETIISQNHYNPSHRTFPSTKTILAQVGGFTPVIDSIRDKLGTIAAVVFGVIWRYCQMENGKCTASQNRIAERSGYSQSTALRSIKKLINNGYLRSETSPGIGVTYYDTGRAQVRVDISAFDDRVNTQVIQTDSNNPETNDRGTQLPVSERHTYLCQRDTPPISERQTHLCQSGIPPMSERHTKRVFKKDLKESVNDRSEYATNIQPNATKSVTNSNPDEIRKDKNTQNNGDFSEIDEKNLEKIERQYVDWFCEIAKVELPINPSHYAKWIEQVGEWIALEVKREEIKKAIEISDEKGLSVVRPASITNIIKSEMAYHKRGGNHKNATDENVIKFTDPNGRLVTVKL